MNNKIVPTNMAYNSYLLMQNLSTLNRKFPFLNIQVVGNSILGVHIPVVKLGNGTKQVFYSGSIHANEWICSVLLMKFIEDYCVAFTTNDLIYGYSARDLFRSTSIYLMPMVNPDGVILIFTGIFILVLIILLIQLLLVYNHLYNLIY